MTLSWSPEVGEHRKMFSSRVYVSRPRSPVVFAKMFDVRKLSRRAIRRLFLDDALEYFHETPTFPTERQTQGRS